MALSILTERLGEPVEVPAGPHGEAVEGAAEEGTGPGAAALWRSGLAPALLGGGLAALLATLTGLVVARRRQAASCLRRDCSLHQICQPHPQLYTTEPSKRNGKTLTPPDAAGELHEISPYATFSMSGGAGGASSAGECGAAGDARGAGGAGGGGCALHLRTFGRAEALDLTAPPPRPNLLAHTPEYGRSRDSDSESSGSPCAACAAELYRVPAAHLSHADTLPAVESSAEDTVYGSQGSRAARGRHGARARHTNQPTVRFQPAAAYAHTGLL